MMKAVFVAFALSGASVASALGSGSGLQVPSLSTGGASILDASESLAVPRRHLTTEDMEQRERGKERRERGKERRERGMERRERGMGDGGEDDGMDVSPAVAADIEKSPVVELTSDGGGVECDGGFGPLPGPHPALGPAGSPSPGPPLPVIGTPSAPRPAGPPMPGPPLPGLAPAPEAAETDRDSGRTPDQLQDGPSDAGPYGLFSAADNDGNSDGQITLEEMTTFVEGNREREIGLVEFFYESDENGDDSLDADELALVDPAGAFDGTDTDGDGIVTLEEASAYANLDGCSWRVLGLLPYFKEVDANGDDVVDVDELQAAQDSGLLGSDC